MATKPAFAPKAQIEHSKFGCGTILSCEEDYVVNNFDDHGEKKYIATNLIPNLKKIDREPPPEKRATRARRSRAKKTTKKTAKTAKTVKAPKAVKAAKAAK